MRAIAHAGSASNRERERRSLLDDDLGADLHAIVEVDRIDIAHTDTARGHAAADALRLVRAMVMAPLTRT